MSRKQDHALGAASPEWRLILACARTRVDDLQRRRIQELLNGPPLEWANLISLAVKHRVDSLVSRILWSEFSDQVPAPFLVRLKEAAGIRGHRNLFLTGRMIGLIDLFDSAGLTVIPHKGPTLASLAYGNLALRGSDDLDFVLPQSEVPRAYRLLLDDGLQTALDPLIARDARFLERGDLGQYLFFADHGSVMIELHSEKTLRYFPAPLEWEGLRTRMEAVLVGGRSVRTFSVEDLMVLLSVHGAKHFWNRLSWICDIAELAQIPRGVDWELSEKLARRMGCRRMWLLGLSLAHEMLDAPIPEPVANWIRKDPGVALLRKRVLTAPVGQEQAPINAGLGRLRFRLLSHERLADGLRQCVRVTTRPTEDDWSHLVLPKWAEPLYVVLRPWHLIRKHGVRRRRGPAIETPSAVSDAGCAVPTEAESCLIEERR